MIQAKNGDFEIYYVNAPFGAIQLVVHAAGKYYIYRKWLFDLHETEALITDLNLSGINIAYFFNRPGWEPFIGEGCF